MDVALNHAETILRNRGPQGMTPLMKIARTTNDPRTFEEALAIPNVLSTLNQQDDDGMTALMYAAERASGDVVEKLVRAGADKALKNNQGETAADIWGALSLDDFDGDNGVKQHFLALLHGGRRRKTRKSKGRKARKTRRH